MRKADRETRVISIVRNVRLLFNEMAEFADGLHADLSITSSMRAVLECLVTFGPQTVPQIAGRRSVSRQHIQIIINDLIKAGLVVPAENPAHKRSKLMRLSSKGVDTFDTIRIRERPYFEKVSEIFSLGELVTTEKILSEMVDMFDELNQNHPHSDHSFLSRL